jgi:hypothetical protein
MRPGFRMCAEDRIRGIGRRQQLLAAILLYRLCHDGLHQATRRLG